MDINIISPIGWIALIVTLTTALNGAMMFILGSLRLHFLWGLFCVFVCVWSGSFFFITQAPDPETARFWWKIAYVGIIINPAFFFHFAFEFIERRSRFVVPIVYIISIGFAIIGLTTNLIVDGMRFVFGFYYDSPPGHLLPYLTAFFLFVAVFAHYRVFQAYIKSRDHLFRQRTEHFFLATIIGFAGVIPNFLPVYGIDIHPATILTIMVAWPLVGYSILKYRLFNIRVVMAQFLTLILTVFTFVHIVLSRSVQEGIFNALLLVMTFALGVYLIRSVRREVEQREKIEQLAKDLQSANQKLKELDRLKSQFLSIASHDLRSPLGVIRNFMSLLIDGTYGKLPPAAQEGAHTVFDRATDMAKSVDSYLNVSRIEQGSMKYDFTDADLTKLVAGSVKAYEPIARQKGLVLTLSVQPGAETLPMKLDIAKMNEVFNNLLDNSIKYTPKGSLVVSVEKKGANARVVIQDTGIGMTPETIEKLFKLFSTADDSRKTNTSSTGVGLYITKAHIEAHKGRISAESEGKDRGSRFIVELPVL